MKTITTIAILTLLMLGFFIWPKIALAADSDIVISEIGAYEAGDHEWVEIFNRGLDPVDLTGWKFFEDSTNHGLTAYQGDFIIEPGEYAIIADVAANFKIDYPGFSGTILDSSWTTLNQDGEALALKNKSLEIIESFTYLACPDTSLQRRDLTLADYTEDNWRVHATANSAGRINEFETGNNDNNDNNPPNNPPPENQFAVGSIVINEFVSDPVTGEDEWIELYNLNSFSVDLTGWSILDGSNTTTELMGLIEAQAFFVINKPKGALNNGGDVIILNSAEDKTIDEVYYGNWQAPEGYLIAPSASDPNSTARQIDGQGDFVITQTPTKGEANQITPLPSATITETTTVNPKEIKIDYKNIIINEILPNPRGSDLNDEFIELKNIGSVDMSLGGYQLSDNSKLIYKITDKDLPSIFIQPNQLVSIKRSISGLALDNDGDYVKLISPENKTLETVKFNEEPSIPEDVSWSRDQNNDWFWSTTLTPGENNIITKLNHAPIIEIYCPKQALKGELIICDASDSYDLENDSMQFTWQANDQIFTQAMSQIQFNQPGNFNITLTVSDAQLSSEQTVKIKIIGTEKSAPTVKATAATTTAKTSNTSTQIAAQVEDPQNSVLKTDLKNIKSLAIGTNVISQGVVSALPNTFGKTIMYLAGSGTQLYMSKGDWPDLNIGDKVEIYGSISESQGNKRIKLATAQDIVVLDQEPEPEPQTIKIEEINDDVIDYLVQIQGVLLEKKSTKFYIKDDTGEAEVYINSNTKINKTNYKEGDELTVTGILRKYNGVYQILPRFQDDLIKNIEAIEQDTVTLPAEKQSDYVLNYLLATAVMLGLGVVATVYYKKKIKKDEA